MPNKVLVTSLDKRVGPSTALEIKNAALKILKILHKNNILVEIYLINSQKMRFLNKKFRGKNKTTTVLSFEEPRNFIYPPEKTQKIKRIGEIYLNLSKVNSQLSTARLLIHGLLHLLGYNHHKKSDRIKMEKMEQQILESLQ